MMRHLLEALPAGILGGSLIGFNVLMRKERRDMPPYVDFWTDIAQYDPKDGALFIPRRGALSPLGWKFWWARLLCLALAVGYVVALNR